MAEPLNTNSAIKSYDKALDLPQPLDTLENRKLQKLLEDLLMLYQSKGQPIFQKIGENNSINQAVFVKAQYLLKNFLPAVGIRNVRMADNSLIDFSLHFIPANNGPDPKYRHEILSQASISYKSGRTIQSGSTTEGFFDDPISVELAELCDRFNPTFLQAVANVYKVNILDVRSVSRTDLTRRTMLMSNSYHSDTESATIFKKLFVPIS